MRRSRLVLVIFALGASCAAVAFSGCGLVAWFVLPGRSQSAAPHGAPPPRVLAISPSPRGGMPLTPLKIAHSVKIAARAGVTGDQLFNLWNEMEPRAGKIDVSSPKGGIDYLGGKLDWTLEFTIGTINTTARVTPPDLQTVAFDDPRMIARFHKLLDAIVPILNSRVAYISVGNEVDVYLARHPEQWPQYRRFYDDAVAYLHSKAPGVKVGVATTWFGTRGISRTQVAELNAKSDVWIITYYPTHSDFIVDPPTAPRADFPAIVRMAGGKPVVLQEVGYPSSPALNSSPELQAEFVRQVFGAWSAAGPAIPFLNYVMEHDLNRDYCATRPAYYGLPDRSGHFAAYFCTLGLLTVDGAEKAGWNPFLHGAAQLNDLERGAPLSAK
jgi:hypothetical protein